LIGTGPQSHLASCIPRELIFHHERPLYRLLDPENFIYLVSGIVKNIEKVGSEKYLNLILDRLRIVLQDNRIGILRGAASNHKSDIDILLVSDSFEGVSHRGLTSYTKSVGG